MPHRATYIFPRQFPDRRLDESSQQFLDHERKKILDSIKSGTFGAEGDHDKKKPSLSSTTPIKNDVIYSPSKHSAVSNPLTGGGKLRAKHKQVVDIGNWSTEKKGGRSGHVKPHSHRSFSEEERELLLPPESSVPPPPLSPETVKNNSAIDQSFDRQVSLPRLSSNGSSYAGSLFSGTTLDGNFSSDIIKEETTSSLFTSSRKQDNEDEKESKDKMVQKSKESYHLQLTLAKRLTGLASIATEPALTLGTEIETWDAESVSYRLWVRS